MTRVRRRPVNTITARYQSYNFRGEVIRLPMLKIRLFSRNRDHSLRTHALIDSGATTSFLPTDLAEVLGLRNLGRTNAEGAGGTFDAWETEAHVEILKGSRACCEMDIGMLVPFETGRVPYAVLGRDSVFEEFDITFSETRQMLVMRRSRKEARR